MRRHKLLSVPLLLLTFAACGGGGGGGGSTPTATPTPNAAPVLNVPAGLSGGPVRFSFVLPMASSQTLTFTAVDGDGDPLLWQLGGAGPAMTAAGMVFGSPVRGASFPIELQAVAAPAAATVNILVEDSRGAASSIDVLFVRSGAPTITGVAPDSAFATAPQQVQISGSAFSLGNSVLTRAWFGGALATFTTVTDENTLVCNTPSGAALGGAAVTVDNQFGSSALPPSAFTMYEYPVNFLDADNALDGGAGEALAVASDGLRMHTVWIEGGMLMHRSSVDGGATFAASQVLSGTDVPSQPHVAVVGDQVTVVWLGDSSLRARSSSDGGATFGPVAILGNSGTIFSVHLVASGNRRYCAWMSHLFPSISQRVHMTSSEDGGNTWRTATSMTSGTNNQIFHAIGCDSEVAWIAAVDPLATQAGLFVSRTTDGGATWSAGQHVGPVSSDMWSPCTCNVGARVYLAWMSGGALQYLVSVDRGATWPNQATELRPASMGLASSPSIACDGDRLSAVYMVGSDTIGYTRVGSAGAFPEHVTLSTVVEPVGAPQVGVCGNYVFAAWRGGDLGTGTARIRFASSVDRGLTFTAPVGLGDGAAAQDEPQLVVDGARMWLGWRDSRGATPALFFNRTEQ